MLKLDHKRIDELLSAAQQNHRSLSLPQEPLLQIKDELLQHMDLEERFLYAECGRFSDLRMLIEKSFDEHQLVKDLLVEMTGERSEAELESKFDELLELVKNHIDDEETELYKVAYDRIEQSRLNEIGRNMAASRTKGKAAA